MTFPVHVLVLILHLLNSSDGGLNPLIIDGKHTPIKAYPHSVYLLKDNTDGCAASILNQYILLTAAHCVGIGSKILYITGTTKLNEHSIARAAAGVRIHKSWKGKKISRGKPLGDIALVKMPWPLKFGDRVKRIAIMKSPPYHEPASIAGWGSTDHNSTAGSSRLSHLRGLQVWSREECMDRFVEFKRRDVKPLPKDTFCAGYSDRSPGEPFNGDSGSALVVRDHIQIGIMSNIWDTDEGKELPIYVYTNVSYYYKWIARNAKKLFCQDRESKILYTDCLLG